MNSATLTETRVYRFTGKLKPSESLTPQAPFLAPAKQDPPETMSTDKDVRGMIFGDGAGNTLEIDLFAGRAPQAGPLRRGRPCRLIIKARPFGCWATVQLQSAADEPLASKNILPLESLIELELDYVVPLEDLIMTLSPTP